MDPDLVMMFVASFMVSELIYFYLLLQLMFMTTSQFLRLLNTQTSNGKFQSTILFAER